MILHTQSFTGSALAPPKIENLILSNELNIKFSFSTKVIPHKEKYWVIKFNSLDAVHLKYLIESNMHSSMKYKIPKV
jgi:hypothetical protein